MERVAIARLYKSSILRKDYSRYNVSRRALKWIIRI